MDEPEGAGWILFAGIMILIAGILNVIWGIAAISNSKFFTQNTTYILSSLNTWGWIVLIIGVAEIFAGFSIWSGGSYGRRIGIIAAQLDRRTDVDLRVPLLGSGAARHRHPHHLRARRIRRAAQGRRLTLALAKPGLNYPCAGSTHLRAQRPAR